MSRVQMQLRLNFDQRMMYDQTNKSVCAGDVARGVCSSGEYG